MSNSLPFLRSWSRDPMAVGLPFVSTPWTARQLALATLDAAIPGAGPVVELGAGTGPVTKALLDAGCPADNIVLVERDAELCSTLAARFPNLHVLHGDALSVDTLLAKAGISFVSVVLSGLPMRAVAPSSAARCYGGAFKLMPSGGAIIQYTYGFKSPVDPELPGLELDASFVGREWRNFPPIAIWRYRLNGPAPPAANRNG